MRKYEFQMSCTATLNICSDYAYNILIPCKKKGVFMYEDLKEKDIAVFEFIKEHSGSKGYPPSVREICKSKY